MTVNDTNTHIERQSEPSPQGFRTVLRALRFLLIVLLIMGVMVGAGLLLIKGEGSFIAVGESVRHHENQLLLFRMFLYLVITVGGPLIVFRRIPDRDNRQRQTIRFMWVFALMFAVGEIFVIQNILGRLLQGA